MDSEIGERSASWFSETSVFESTSQVKTSSKGKIKATETWEHAREAEGDEPKLGSNGKKLLYCIYCTKNPPYSTWVTANFRRHLQSGHDILVKKDESHVSQATNQQLLNLYRLMKKDSRPDYTKDFLGAVLEDLLDQDVLNQAIVSFFIRHDIPFRVVGSPEFHTICRILNPVSKGFIRTSHGSFRDLLRCSFTSQREIVQMKIQSAKSSVHLSLDIWTSPNRLLLLGVCAHFFSREEERLEKALLGLRVVSSHSGKDQFEALLPLLREYEVITKIGAVVCDNASTNDALLRTMGTYLEEEQKLSWNPLFYQIRCVGHIINLAVQRYLFPKGTQSTDLEEELDDEEQSEKRAQATRDTFGTLGKLHNIVVYIRSSPVRTAEFRNLAGKLVPLDNRTRWNSWFHLLQASDSLSSQIDSFTKSNPNLRPDYLGLEDWETVRIMKDFLNVFSDATLFTQGDSATLDRTLFTMEILIRFLESELVSYFPFPPHSVINVFS